MDFVRAALALPRRRLRSAVSATAFVAGVRPMPADASPARIEVLLCESEDGRLVLVDPGRLPPDGALLPLGRADIEPHHLSPPARSRLQVDGRTRLDGHDAENALLAFGRTAAGASREWP